MRGRSVSGDGPPTQRAVVVVVMIPSRRHTANRRRPSAAATLTAPSKERCGKVRKGRVSAGGNERKIKKSTREREGGRERGELKGKNARVRKREEMSGKEKEAVEGVRGRPGKG